MRECDLWLTAPRRNRRSGPRRRLFNRLACLRLVSEIVDWFGCCAEVFCYGCFSWSVSWEVGRSLSLLRRFFESLPGNWWEYNRGYHETKLQENVDAEIFGVLLEEAKEAFDEEIVVELNSEKDDEVESNCERIATWVESWKKDQAENADDWFGLVWVLGWFRFLSTFYLFGVSYIPFLRLPMIDLRRASSAASLMLCIDGRFGSVLGFC